MSIVGSVLSAGILAYIAYLFSGEDSGSYFIAFTGVNFSVLSSLFLDDLRKTMTKMMPVEQHQPLTFTKAAQQAII